MEFTLAPRAVIEKTGILGAEVVEQAVVSELPAPETGGWCRTYLRRALRRARVLPPAAMGRNVLKEGEVALRVITSQGAAMIAIPDSELAESADIWGTVAERLR